MSELTGIRRAYDAIEGPNEEAVATARELLLHQVESTESTGASLRKRRAGVVAIAAAVVVGALLVSPAFGIGSRLLDLIRDQPEPPGDSPTWSPDGTKIAFLFNAPHGYELRIMNADGSSPRTVLESAGDPVWSPDWQKIAFQSGAWNGVGEPGIAVVNADGSGRRLLSAEPSAHRPAWSPDGKQIAFISWRDRGPGNPDVYVMNADGSERRLLTRRGESPVWSPDGPKIAFASRRDGNFEIYLMNADGSGRRNLTRNPRDDVGGAWSPDGNKIAFSRRVDGRMNFEIYVMNADGSAQRRLTRDAGSSGNPV